MNSFLPWGSFRPLVRPIAQVAILAFAAQHSRHPTCSRTQPRSSPSSRRPHSNLPRAASQRKDSTLGLRSTVQPAVAEESHHADESHRYHLDPSSLLSLRVLMGSNFA